MKSQHVWTAGAALMGLTFALYLYRNRNSSCCNNSQQQDNSTKDQQQQTSAVQQRDQSTATAAATTADSEQQTRPIVEQQTQQTQASAAETQDAATMTKTIEDYFDDIRTGIFTINAHKIVHAIKKILELDANNFEAHVIKILCEEINHQALRGSGSNTSRIIAA